MKEINMIGEAKVNGQKRKALAWNFFKKLSKTHAECNYCHGVYNYQTTLSHLLKHVKKKHPDALLQFKKQALEKEINNFPVSPSDEISLTSWPAVEVLLRTEESESGEKNADEEQSSDIWSLFTRIDEAFAECNLCQVKLSCSISDLTVHREVEHPGVLLKYDSSEDEPSRNGLCDIPAEGNCSMKPQSSKDSSSNDVSDEPAAETSANDGEMKLRRSPTWQYFTLIDKNYAQCKICRITISHISFSNLMRHLIRKHPCELVARARNGEQKDAEKNLDDISNDALALQPENQSTISDVEEESEGETSEEINEIRKTTSDAQISDQTSVLHRSKRMKTDEVDTLHEESPTMETEWEDVSVHENLQSSQDQNGVSEDNTETGERKRIGPRSSVWKMFTKLNNGCSKCKICGTTMSKKSCVSNLLRHMKRAHPHIEYAVERKIAESGVSTQNRPRGEAGSAQPIIHSFERETKSASTHSDQETDEPQTACGSSDSLSSELLANAIEEQNRRIAKSTSTRSDRVLRRIGESQTACDTSGCLLSERLVLAVEEGNHLLRSLQSAVERQGEALDRLVACLEGMNRVQKNDV